jgi:hypothetical protein
MGLRLQRSKCQRNQIVIGETVKSLKLGRAAPGIPGAARPWYNRGPGPPGGGSTW